MLLTIFLCFSLWCFKVQGAMNMCEDVYPPVAFGNCTFICSLRFRHFMPNAENDEFALCKNNTSTAISCASHTDCRPHHIGAYCKLIPCLCEAHPGSQTIYLHPSSQIPGMSFCVVSSKWKHPNLPLVPFPWKTLLIVFGILLLFALCLIGLRWISPFLRAMQSERSGRQGGNQFSSGEDGASFFAPVPCRGSAYRCYFRHGMPQLYRASQQLRNPRPSHGGYVSCSQRETNVSSNTLSNQDKPPAYEVAIQAPPSYEELVNEAHSSNNEADDARKNLCETTQSTDHQVQNCVSVTDPTRNNV